MPVMRTESIPLEGELRRFLPDRRDFCSKTRAKLIARRAELSGFVASGTAHDFADYRYRCGQIQALTEAIDICQQLENEGN